MPPPNSLNDTAGISPTSKVISEGTGIMIRLSGLRELDKQNKTNYYSGKRECS